MNNTGGEVPSALIFAFTFTTASSEAGGAEAEAEALRPLVQ